MEASRKSCRARANPGTRIARVAAALLALRTAGIDRILKLVPRHAA